MGALALVLVFLVSSGGSDFVQSNQQSRPAPGGLGEEARKDLEAQAVQFEAELKMTPGNLEALEVRTGFRGLYANKFMPAGLEKLLGC